MVLSGLLFVLGAVGAYHFHYLVGVTCFVAAFVFVVGYGDSRSLEEVRRQFKDSGWDVLVITSDSPKWCAYIQSQWLTSFGSRAVVVNRSRQEHFADSPAGRFVRKFGPSVRSYCPVVIFFPPNDAPRQHRFFYAFRDHKHGKDAALKRQEERMFEEFDKLFAED